jgi:hypothetical protein
VLVHFQPKLTLQLLHVPLTLFNSRLEKQGVFDSLLGELGVLPGMKYPIYLAQDIQQSMQLRKELGGPRRVFKQHKPPALRRNRVCAVSVFRVLVLG